MFIPFNSPAPDPDLVQQLNVEQLDLAKQVILQKSNLKIKYIAGCDSSFIDDDNILSVFVLMKYPSLEVVEKVSHISPVELAYIPGFQAFREIPNLMKAYDKLQQKPDLIMIEGHGVAHPRRLGVASHLGVVLGKPTIGVAKKLLVGKYQTPELTKGASTPILHKGDHVANAICTKDNTKPVYVSAGHLIDLQSATDIAIKTSVKHKLPEPVWYADNFTEKHTVEEPA